MLTTKQILVISGTILLIGVLVAQPIKSLVKEDTAEEAQANTTNESFTPESVYAIAKQGLNANIQQEITALEERIGAASEEKKLSLLKQLATKWNGVNKISAEAFTLEEIAKKEANYENWLKAGDAFAASYHNIQDTVLAPVLTDRALQAYEKALALNSNSLEAKTGLGSAYVNGTNPMKGITMLLEVVKEDPTNLKANFNLGLFSMQSRQFDKAVDRFKTVVDQKPDPEAWFYLATSYENIGLKKEAIAAFEKSKQLAADPSLSQFIDRKINELSK